MTSSESSDKSAVTESDANNDRERRKSSADNLERLYTIIAGLCLATAVGHLLSEVSGQEPNEAPYLLIVNIRLRYDVLPMFVALIVTLLPFYHGANRYIFDTYVLGTNGLPSPLWAMVDYAFFFCQALLFYAMALVLSDGAAFYTLLIALLVSDCAWSMLAVVGRRANWSNANLWLLLNAVTILMLVIALAVPVWPNDIEKWTVLAVIATLRTGTDYMLGRQFYWPGLTLWGTGRGEHHANAHHPSLAVLLQRLTRTRWS